MSRLEASHNSVEIYEVPRQRNAIDYSERTYEEIGTLLIHTWPYA